jgi:peptidoglycan/LPS O-acetylase OafA/YrhL
MSERAGPANDLPDASAYFPGIQILRGVAALLVVVCHTFLQIIISYGQSTLVGNIVTFGASGVDIFFVISGFVITNSMFGKREIQRNHFIVNRLLRIYPIYWIVITAMLLLNAAGLFKSMDSGVLDIALSYLLLPVDYRVLTISWTLTYEIAFYLLVYFTLFLRHRRLLFVLANLVPLTLLVFFSHRLGWRLDFFQRDEAMLEFGAGMVLAYIYHQTNGRFRIPLSLGVLGLCYLLASAWLLKHEPNLPPMPRALTWGPAAALVVASVLHVPAMKGRVFQLLRHVGDASYSIYLTHVFIIGAYHYALEHTFVAGLNQVIPILGVLGSSVVLGLLSYRFVERPLLRALRKVAFRHERQARSTPGAQPAAES